MMDRATWKRIYRKIRIARKEAFKKVFFVTDPESIKGWKKIAELISK